MIILCISSIVISAICCGLVAQLCLTLCDPVECSLPGSSLHGILQARILGWVAISFSRGVFQTQESNPHLLCLLHCQVDSLSLRHLALLDQMATQFFVQK